MTGSDPAKTGLRKVPAPAQSSNNPVTYGWLTKRSEFLNCAKGERAHDGSFMVQCAPNPAAGGETVPEVRFGLTVSKRNGNAVRRNRIKRRLRAVLAGAVADGKAGAMPGSSAAMAVRNGCDYVIVAKPNALSASFPAMVDGLRRAMAKIQAAGSSSRARNNKRSPARS